MTITPDIFLSYNREDQARATGGLGPSRPGPPQYYDRQGRSEASVARRLPHQAQHRQLLPSRRRGFEQ